MSYWKTSPKIFPKIFVFYWQLPDEGLFLLCRSVAIEVHSLLLEIIAPIFFSFLKSAPIVEVAKQSLKLFEELQLFVNSSLKIFWISFFNSKHSPGKIKPREKSFVGLLFAFLGTKLYSECTTLSVGEMSPSLKRAPRSSFFLLSSLVELIRWLLNISPATIIKATSACVSWITVE